MLRLFPLALHLAVLALSSGAAPAAPDPAPTARAPVTSAVLGPAAICHPIPIGPGDGESLPWDGVGGFSISKAYDVERTVPDTLALLSASGDTLLHMETLRRAVIYVTEMGREEKSSTEVRAARVSRLCSELERVLARRLELEQAESESVRSGSRALGLAWFDVGYVRGALDQIGFGQPRAAEGAVRGAALDRGEAALERALALLPGDGAAHLGFALATWMAAGKDLRYRHLDKALELAEDRTGLLARSLLATTGPMLHCKTLDELVTEVRRGRERG